MRSTFPGERFPAAQTERPAEVSARAINCYSNTSLSSRCGGGEVVTLGKEDSPLPHPEDRLVPE